MWVRFCHTYWRRGYDTRYVVIVLQLCCNIKKYDRCHLNMYPATNINIKQLLLDMTCVLGWTNTFSVLKYILHFVDIDDCRSNSCKNDGTCIDGVNDYTCNCATGYTGDNCETGMSESTMNHSDENIWNYTNTWHLFNN